MHMQTSRHAIKVTPGAEGWTWELIDSAAGKIAFGVAPDQEGVMESGWRAARSIVPASSNQFPEIFLGDREVRH
jgi:hypothetical protein